jgi:flagellar hook protein FlgE
MSLYGALYSGVSGLSSQASAMGAISDNVTNVNTTGYKGTKVNFQTLITKQVSLTKYSAGGVQSKPRAGIDVQGLLQATSSATDLGMSGQGFFVTNSNADPATSGSGLFTYTRAGSFKVDKEGYMQNVGGVYLQGWPLASSDGSSSAIPTEVAVSGNDYMKAYKQADGTWHYCNQNIVNENELKPLNLNTIGGTADPTSQIKLGANLPSGDDIFDPSISGSSGYHQTNVLIYDSLGNTHSLNYNWMKTAANTWNVQTKTDVFTITDSIATTNAADTAADFTVSINGSNVTVLANGGTTGCAFSAANGTITFATAADSASLPVGTVFTIANAEDSGNDGTYMVTTSAAGVVTITSSKYLVQRGLQPPVGTATTILYDTANSGNLVYAAQGRLDFTAASRADVTALNGKSVAVTIGAVTTTFTFDTTGAAVDTATTKYINISNAAIDTGAEVAALVANAMRTPQYYIAANTLNGAAGSGALVAGQTLPYYYTDGATVFMVQQSNGEAISFDVSSLQNAATGATYCTQAATRLWSAGPPPTDSASGTFTIPEIDQTANAVVFNGDGTPQDINVTKIGLDFANGSQSMKSVSSDTDKRMSLFMGSNNQPDGLTQLAGTYQVTYITQNGAKFGNFSGVSVSSEGIVTALFDNGVRRPVFQIPIATFINPNGLESLTGNAWIETDVSGAYTLRTAGQAGSGTVASASLEASTVDLGEEFTVMITTQRAYSAAAKIITTSDQMLEELVNIKR